MQLHLKDPRVNRKGVRYWHLCTAKMSHRLIDYRKVGETLITGMLYFLCAATNTAAAAMATNAGNQLAAPTLAPLHSVPLQQMFEYAVIWNGDIGWKESVPEHFAFPQPLLVMLIPRAGKCNDCYVRWNATRQLIASTPSCWTICTLLWRESIRVFGSFRTTLWKGIFVYAKTINKVDLQTFPWAK